MVENTGAAGGGRRMHAILLVQMSKHESTRSYSDYPSVQDALEGLLDIYETRLREQHPNSKAVSYDLRNLFNFLDDMKDLKALTWDSSLQAYKAWDKAWVKARLQAFLLEQGQARGK